jgi:hypothetical protein
MWKIIRSNHRIKYVVVLGSIGFVVFYILSAIKYPGGSDFDTYSKGFSLTENYWCELLGAYAKNGRPNHGKPYAFVSLAFLNITLFSIWFYFGYYKSVNNQPNYLLIVSGTISTFFSNFVSTNAHDYYIALSVLFGVISILQMIRIQKQNNHFLFLTGLLAILLIILNCFMYFFNFHLLSLPIIQKITFIFILSWFTLNVIL